jgi:hypothetical protein
VTSASAPSGTGSASVSGNVVQLRNLSIKPGKSLSVSLKVTTPLTCGASYSWSVQAKETSNFSGSGDDFFLVTSASQLTTQVNGSCTLAWGTQPHNALVLQTITGTDYDTNGPPLTVRIVDGGGRVVTSASGTVTVAIGNNPGGAKLGGTTSAGTSGGVATFSDLTLDKAGNGYTLTASGPGFASQGSNSFNESGTGTPCSQNNSCQTSASGSAGNSSTVTASPQSCTNSSTCNAGTLSVAANLNGIQLDCSPPARGGYTSPNLDTFEFKMNPSTNRSEVWTATSKSFLLPLTQEQINQLLNNPQVCYGSNTDFVMPNGAMAPPGQLPDGTPGFIGTVPNCPITPPGPCIDQANVTKVPDLGSPIGFDITVPVNVPPGQGDPARH